jgi:ubiquitin-protein ligase
MSVMRAIITGPPDTPYAHGCFVFDIYIPPTYPKNPPHVLLNNTG